MGFVYNQTQGPLSYYYTISLTYTSTWVNEKYTPEISPKSGTCLVQVIKPANGSAGDMTLRLYGKDFHTGEKTLIGTWVIENITGAPTYRSIYLGDLLKFSSFYFSVSFQADGTADATVHLTIKEVKS